jgi:rubrerythrin
MNKHQEALDRLENFAYYGGEKGDNVKIIQELVDKVPNYEKLEAKAKPMKPEMIPYKGYLIEEATYQGCPSCKNPTYRDWTMFERSRLPKFCPNCGQALDWSENE